MLQQIFTLSFMTAFLAAAVRLAVPLMYGGIGETIAEKSGILNIGMEGVMLSGAFFSFAGAWYSGNLFVGLLAGMLGGLGGLVFVVPTSTNFNADVAGYGFLALAVLIFGQWKPVKIMWASLFFGLMKAVAAAYSGIPFLAATGIPSYVYKMIPYLATLVVLVFTSKNSQAPRASGIPYDKGQR